MFNESNPPRGLEEMKARNQASSMLADMLAEIMLESNAPEEIKLGVRIVQQGKKVSKAAHEIMEAFAGDPATLKSSDTETLKQFMETTKSPNANNAPNEI